MFSRTRGLRDVLKSPLPWLLGISFGADAFLQTGVITTLARGWQKLRRGCAGGFALERGGDGL